MLTIKAKRLNGHLFPLPKRETAGASGYDLCANIDLPYTVRAGSRYRFPTGWAFEIPVGYEGQVRPRSGHAYKAGITVTNSPGTIDADYRGETHVMLINHGMEDFVVTPGMRIAQIVFMPVPESEMVEVNDLSETERGAGGYGSTGTQVAASA